jgi:signal transduction histidine kinase
MEPLINKFRWLASVVSRYVLYRVTAIGFFAALLLAGSLFVIRDNQAAHKQIKAIVESQIALLFELTKLLNHINLASDEQRAYFESGDTLRYNNRISLWDNKITPSVHKIREMAKELPPEDTVQVGRVINLVVDFQIIQDELDFSWSDIQDLPPGQVKKEALNTLNDRLLEWASYTRDKLSATLIPIQQRYEENISLELEFVIKSLDQSNADIVIGVIVSLILMGVFISITMHQSKLELAKNRAELAVKEKSEFLANMSHELRTPLNAILGFSEIVSRKLIDEKLKGYMNHITKAGHSLLAILNDILDLTMLEGDKVEINKVVISIEDYITEIKGMFAVLPDNKEIQFESVISPQLPSKILIDGQRLRQILFNLVGNAIKFTETGGRVALRVSIMEKSRKSFIVFDVEDNGIGIPEDKQEIIFEAFRQEDGHATRKYGGTGLGLTIARRLANLLGGTISLKSKVGVGSTFTLTVPYQKQAEE